jgi:hypothetical protein
MIRDAERQGLQVLFMAGLLAPFGLRTGFL